MGVGGNNMVGKNKLTIRWTWIEPDGYEHGLTSDEARAVIADVGGFGIVTYHSVGAREWQMLRGARLWASVVEDYRELGIDLARAAGA